MVQLSAEQLNNLGKEALVIIVASLQDHTHVLRYLGPMPFTSLTICRPAAKSVKNLTRSLWSS